MNKKWQMYLDFLLYDALPFIVALGVLLLLIVKVPTIFVGVLIGWLSCKYQEKIKSAYERVKEKLNESRDL